MPPTPAFGFKGDELRVLVATPAPAFVNVTRLCESWSGRLLQSLREIADRERVAALDRAAADIESSKKTASASKPNQTTIQRR